MLRKLSLLVMCGALSGVGGCGDSEDANDAGGGGPDAGRLTSCPTTAPLREQMMGECCYRIPNDGDRASSPELRLAALELRTPEPISNLLIASVLRLALDEETFNWILRLDITDSTASVTTGYGERQEDGTFRFLTGTAPGPGPADRWDPITLSGTFADETVTTEPVTDPLTVPVFDVDGTTLTTEFPLLELQLQMATLSADRSCIGTRERNMYTTEAASIQAYIEVDAAKATPLVAGSIDSTLCMLFINRLNDPGTCDDFPRSEWPAPPDTLCDETGCTRGSCDPVTECNAWHVTAGIAAQAVEIH